MSASLGLHAARRLALGGATRYVITKQEEGEGGNVLLARLALVSVKEMCIGLGTVSVACNDKERRKSSVGMACASSCAVWRPSCLGPLPPSLLLACV